ncbi:MAG: type II secretion system major pseudopilin GspG [Phycisphaerales bacterium]|nr:MAG: type II secretion system major pseudopilin GspG [Phycisphaerales bacterium]
MRTRKQQYYKPCRGFTLIELMIVVVILGLLATTIMPKLLSKPDKTRVQKAKFEIRQIETALAMFRTDNGRFPTTSEGLQALVSNPGRLPDYDPDGYLPKVPLDPWKNSYIYISPGLNGRGYDLVSYGKDGENGGTGYDADIESWNLDE